MLTFTEKEELYRITETITGNLRVYTKTVDFTKDLAQKRVNSEPFRDTSPADKKWFNKHYKKHFDK